MKRDFDAFEVVPKLKPNGKTFLSTRFGDTEDKSRFVSREFNGKDGSVEFFAPATTNSTAKFIDFIAAKRGHARMIGDFSRAFLQIEEDEEVYVQPPDFWIKDRERRREKIQMWRGR